MKKLLALILIFFATTSLAQDSEKGGDIILYLEHMISGHRQVMALEAAPNNAREVLLTESLRQSSIKAINYAFDFARSQAIALEGAKPTNVYGPVIDQTRKQNLAKIAATVDQKIKDVQDNLEKTPGGPLREKLNSELKLAKAQAELIGSVLALSNTNSEADAGLLKQISNLAKTVPEIQTEQQRKNAKTDATQVVVPQQKSSSAPSRGIIALLSDAYSSFNKRSSLKSIANSNTALRAESQELLESLKTGLKNQIKRGDDIAARPDGEGDDTFSGQKKQLDDLVIQFRQLGASVVPLNQTIIWLDAGARNFTEWDAMQEQQQNDTLRILIFRLMVLAVAISIPVVLSRLANRAINKYSRDMRRKTQLQTLRRIIFTVIIGLIIVLNLITESGSLLTFAGFLTAGLAVALQNVILSTVAYFFFFGRYGVREGDRVTVGTVTGKVIKIGIVRLYLMELAGKDFDFYPTGKIVTFPNSILFQPAAFTKLAPGTNFTWNEIRIILDQDTDYEFANRKLLEAVDLIYKDYLDEIAQQQEALQRATNLHVEIPGPKCTLAFVDAGLAFIVRYPVGIGASAEVHDKITKKLLDVIRAEPLLKLA